MEKDRVKVLMLTIYGCFLMITARFFYWQVWESPNLKEKALAQTLKLEREMPNRGRILFSDGFKGAINLSGWEISIYKPNLTKDINEVFDLVIEVKPELKESQSLKNFIENPGAKWLTLASFFTNEEIEKLKGLGLNFDSVSKRYYPEGDMAKNIIGFVGKDEYGQSVGYGGLEAYYDKLLKGKSGYVWRAKDAQGKTVFTRKGWSLAAVDGEDLETSINRSIQYEVEKVIREGIDRYDAESGSVVVMEPLSGKILAMVSLEGGEEATKSSQRNKVISDLYEPGSVFKPVVVAMGLDSGRIDQGFVCEKCDRPRVIGEYTINNWDFGVHPQSDLKTIIKNSDNIGMSYIMERIGKDTFFEYFDKLGLKKKTGIDLQGEARSVFKQYWSEIDLATASFGQGFGITQIQMVRTFNVLANNGFLVGPSVAGRQIKSERVLKDESVEIVKGILKYAVENGSIAQYKPSNLEVCAKSGTSQVAVEGGYTDDETVGSYIGFSPCQNPKFTMLVTFFNPKSSTWGSSTAAPVWFELASKINRLL